MKFIIPAKRGGKMEKALIEKALNLMALGGDLNRALSDILAWYELLAMDGATPPLPNALYDNADKATAAWRKELFKED